MRKSKFNLGYLNSLTCDAGWLVPFYLQSTLPNDTFRLSLNAFVRAQPMLAPLMHQVYFYTQYWYVPYRLIWNEWEPFITGGVALDSTPAFPTITAPAEGFAVGSLSDYFGFPVNQGSIEVSAMPYRALAMIWNTRYRDEDIQSELPLSLDSGNDVITNTSLLSPNMKRDYFTLARAQTQRGSQISVPIGSGGEATLKYGAVSGSGARIRLTSTTSNPPTANNTIYQKTISTVPYGGAYGVVSCSVNSSSVADDLSYVVLSGQFSVSYDGNDGQVLSTYEYTMRVAPANLARLPLQDTPYIQEQNVIDVEDDGQNPLVYYFAPYNANNALVTYSQEVAGLGSFEVGDLRLASALQRYQENSLLWGNRYEEFIQREFGSKPRDSRIDRPEYLGGGR